MDKRIKKIGIVLFNASSSNGTERAVSNLVHILNNYAAIKIYIISVYSYNEASYFFNNIPDISFIQLDISENINTIRKYIILAKRLREIVNKENLYATFSNISNTSIFLFIP
ncbi:hypothetical protein AGMMS49928_28070 [Spirochaetia bacterium]|nr:hypothetical protein AGMMS49928_28070 [Spirochaetia bacterium]